MVRIRDSWLAFLVTHAPKPPKFDALKLSITDTFNQIQRHIYGLRLHLRLLYELYFANTGSQHKQKKYSTDNNKVTNRQVMIIVQVT